MGKGEGGRHEGENDTHYGRCPWNAATSQLPVKPEKRIFFVLFAIFTLLLIFQDLRPWWPCWSAGRLECVNSYRIRKRRLLEHFASGQTFPVGKFSLRNTWISDFPLPEPWMQPEYSALQSMEVLYPPSAAHVHDWEEGHQYSGSIDEEETIKRRFVATTMVVSCCGWCGMRLAPSPLPSLWIIFP